MKKVLFGFILGIIFSSVIAYASYAYHAHDIEFISPYTESDNVEDALNNLYIDTLYDKDVFAEGKPLVPKMTDYECEVGVVRASEEYLPYRTAYKAFDKVYNFGDNDVYTDVDNAWQAKNTSNQYLEFEFNNPVRVSKVELVSTYSSAYSGIALKNAKIMASNDGVNYIDLSDQVTFSNDLGTALKFQVLESKDKINKYKYIRIWVDGSYTTSYGSGIAVREAQIYGWYN